MSERFEERFELVKHYLMDLDLRILKEDADDELVIVDDPENGINNMVIDCEYPILILEQFILESSVLLAGLYLVCQSFLGAADRFLFFLRLYL